MKSILASFFRQHQQHKGWWHKLKITPNLASGSTEVANLAPGKAPLERCVLQLLGITMIELWEVFFQRGLARKIGAHNIINRKNVEQFMTNNELTNVVECGKADKHLVIRIGHEELQK
jgi:hypothetical protein